MTRALRATPSYAFVTASAPLRALLKAAGILQHVVFYTQTFDTPWLRSEPGKEMPCCEK